MRLLGLCLMVLSFVPVACGQGDSASIPRVSAGVLAGQLVTKVQPVLPPEAIKAGVNGAVVMHAIIGRDGRVEELTVVSGPQVLRESYMAAVRQWVYKPFLLNGIPTRVDTTITVMINLGGGAPATVPPVPGQQVEASGLPPGRVHVPSGVVAGNSLTHRFPNFCEIGREQRVSGPVVLHVVIDRTGHVQDATVLSGAPILRQAAVDAVLTWTYKPYLVDGVPTEVDTTVKLSESCGS